MSEEEDRVEFLYERIYQREPAKSEVKAADHFLKSQANIASNSVTIPTWQYGYGEFDASKGLVKFSAFSHFANNQWQGSSTFPDPNLGHAMLNSVGGHPGNKGQHAVIRRWTSPFDGTVKIEGTLSHPSDKHDGVLARIVSSRNGELGSWIDQNGKAETVVDQCKVKRGDTLDFITEMRSGPNNDTFEWGPKIKVVKVEDGTVASKRTNWSAQTDFDGPTKDFKSLTPWEKYAQVLLLSNEFMFVD